MAHKAAVRPGGHGEGVIAGPAGSSTSPAFKAPKPVWALKKFKDSSPAKYALGGRAIGKDRCMRINNNKGFTFSLLVFVVAAQALLFSTPARANSVEDDYGVTWTVTREYNSSSSGYDIFVETDESPVSEYWITSDSLGDKSPWIAIDENSGYPVVVWSKSSLGGYRIRISWFNGTSFGAPQTVTNWGTGFNDLEPHMVIESDGDIHLVFLRDHSSSDGEAVYANYTGFWSTLSVYSANGDEVTGSCMIKLIDESVGQLEATYDHDDSSKQERCKPSTGTPWTSCE